MADQLVLMCFVDVQWIECVSFEIFVAIELEIRTCSHLHACPQPVNLLSVVTPAIKSVCCIGQCSVQAGMRAPRTPYWTWSLRSIRTRKNTELTEEANCSIYVHVH